MSEGQAVLHSLRHLPRKRRPYVGRLHRAVAAASTAALIVAGAACGPQPRPRGDAGARVSPRDGDQYRDGHDDQEGFAATVPTNAPTRDTGGQDDATQGDATPGDATQADATPADATPGDGAVGAAEALHRMLRAALDDPNTRSAVVERAIAPGTELLALARADLARVPTLDAPAIDLTVLAVRGTGTDLLASAGTRRWVVTVQRWDGAWHLAAILPLLDGPPIVVLDADPNGARA